LGDAGIARMATDGITNPVQLVGLYMMLDGDNEEFADYLRDDCGIGEQYIRSERTVQGKAMTGVLEAISNKAAEICAKADAREEANISAVNKIHAVLKQVQPDQELDVAAMAIVDDYQNDIMRRIVENAAAQAEHSLACNLEDEALGEGDSEFEIVRQYVVERTPVTPADADGRPEDSTVEVDLLVSVNQTATGAKFRALPEGPDAAKIRSSRCLTARAIQTAVRLTVPGDLTRHAVSEGTKAITKFTGNTKKIPSASRARRAGLVFDVEAVAARATKQFRV